MFQCQDCGRCFDTTREWTTHKTDFHTNKEN